MPRRTRRPNRKISIGVRWIMGTVHVGADYELVAEDFANRCSRVSPAITGTERAKVITDALIQHRRNRREYIRIMSGGLL